MTKMTATPIYVKNIQKYSFSRTGFYDFDTWYAASGSQAL